jgi:hypothetical protein
LLQKNNVQEIKTAVFFYINLFPENILQSSILTGKINDETNNQPLAGATINIGSGKKNVTAQSDGTYVIQGSDAGEIYFACFVCWL